MFLQVMALSQARGTFKRMIVILPARLGKPLT
jgi:hypothetical protein